MEKLKDYTLEIIVMDKDRIGRNECIGKVIFYRILNVSLTLCQSSFFNRLKNHQKFRVEIPFLPWGVLLYVLFRLYWVTKEVPWKGNTGEI